MERKRHNGEHARMKEQKVTTRFKEPRKTYFFRAWRKKRGMSQEELAAEMGVSTPTISQLETGKQGFTGDTLEALAKALNVEPWELLTRNPNAELSEWSVLKRMRGADNATKDRIARVIDEMLKDGTNG